MQPKINIRSGIDGLAMAKKAELASRVEELAIKDLCDCCLMALTLQASGQNIEEFYNKCHGDDGKFCGGSTGSRGLPGKDRGPGTKRPAPIDYYKDRIRNKMESIRQRKESKAYKKVTVGPVYGGLTTAVWGNVKVKKLAKTDLKDLSTGDLVTLRNKLKSDQRFYNNFAERSVVWLNPVLTAESVLVANWKTANIPPQIDRVDKEVKTRFKAIQDNPLLNQAGKAKKLPYGIGASAEEIEELQLAGLIAAVDEAPIKNAPESVVNLVAEFLLRLEEDEDVSSEEKKKIFAQFK